MALLQLEYNSNYLKLAMPGNKATKMLQMVLERGHRNGVTDGLGMRLLIHTGLFPPTPEPATQTVHLLLEVDDLLDLVVNKLPLSCHQLLTFCGRLVEEPRVNFTVGKFGCEGARV